MITPASLVEEILRFRQASAADTIKLQQYSHDNICQIISDHLHTVLDAFVKYQHINYVVQGPRDNGVDVLLKESKGDEPDKYIAFQVKSYNEIADTKNDLSKQLKAGHHDARSAYGDALQRYYILLFGDSTKHFRRISAITNEFARDKDVRVIGPRDLLTFLKFSAITLSAIVDRHLSDGDVVMKKAGLEVSRHTENQLYFILACLCWAFENSKLKLPDSFFYENPRMLTFATKYGPDAIQTVLSHCEDEYFEIYAMPASRRIRLEIYPAIRALYFDLQVRYDEDPDSLFEHLFEFLKFEVTLE